MCFNVFFEPEKSLTGNIITHEYILLRGWRESRFENVKERKHIHHTQNNVIIVKFIIIIIIITKISDLRCAWRKWHSAGTLEVCRRRTVHNRYSIRFIQRGWRHETAVCTRYYYVRLLQTVTHVWNHIRFRNHLKVHLF